MNKDEIQATKALTKMNCIKKIIEILQTLNLLEDSLDMKQYNIVLDYIKNNNQLNDNDDFTTFKTTIYSNKSKASRNKETKIFDFNFKLKDEATGFAIFKNIREYFLEKNDLQYSSFLTLKNSYDLKKSDPLEVKYKWHRIFTNHNVSLTSMIYTKKDEMKLEDFQDKILKKYDKFVKTINTSNLSKDELQVLKANQKAKIVMTIIDTIYELEECDVPRLHTYDIVLDYKEIKNGKNNFTIFKIKLLKNRTNEIFNINFKLKNKEIGFDLFDKISKYFVKINKNSIKYFADNSHNETNIENIMHIINAYNINLICRMPQQKFDNLYKESLSFSDSAKINVKTK